MSAASKRGTDVRDETRLRPDGPGIPTDRWAWDVFVRFHVIAAVLFVSWIVPFTRVAWDLVDVSWFRVLNGSLSLGDGWLLFWGAANHRSVDLISGSLCAAIIIWWLWGERRETQNRRAVALGALAIPLLVLPFTVHILIRTVLPFQRHSPTLVVDEALRFSDLLPGLATKDISIYSFPGDHSFILFSVAFFFWFYAERRFFLAMLVLAIVFSLPRLVGGAHWLTDDIVGGVAPALIVVAWVCATPFAYRVSGLLLPLVDAVVALIPDRLWIPDYSTFGATDRGAEPTKRR